MKRFAVLQLTGCSGCEIALLNADEWIEEFDLGTLESIVYGIASKELKMIEVLGGVLGFLIGLLQVGILMTRGS